jgi:hypothetical protein
MLVGMNGMAEVAGDVAFRRAHGVVVEGGTIGGREVELACIVFVKVWET